MDERHHHENDVGGKWADARAARDKLAQLDDYAEQQRQLPDLKTMRDAILRDKAEVAAAIAGFGPELYHEQNPDRQRLHDRLTAINLALAGIDAKISAIPAPLAVDDGNAHVEDLHRRGAPDDELLPSRYQSEEVKAWPRV